MSLIKELDIDLGEASFNAIGRDKFYYPIFFKKFTRSKLVDILQQLPFLFTRRFVIFTLFR